MNFADLKNQKSHLVMEFSINFKLIIAFIIVQLSHQEIINGSLPIILFDFFH